MTKSIDFSVIAPPDCLDAFVAQEPASVHHVAAQRVLTDPAYRAFFHREAQRGAEIIVDNGVFDLGHALPAGRRSRDHPPGRHARRARHHQGQ